MELGPFSGVMMASYLAFLEPETVAKLFHKAGKPSPCRSRRHYPKISDATGTTTV